MLNVFEIWRGRGKTVPFRVRRTSWSATQAVTVTRVTDVKVTRTGIYGRAWVCEAWYRGKPGYHGEPGEKALGCAGCYQWEDVTEEVGKGGEAAMSG